MMAHLNGVPYRAYRTENPTTPMWREAAPRVCVWKQN